MSPEPYKPSLTDIDYAPETLPVVIGGDEPTVTQNDFRSRFSEVSNRNFELLADNAALTRRLQTKDVVDNLLEPYANKVFWFLCAYGLVAFAILLLTGFHVNSFGLDPEVLKYVVGSTAVSAIGLVGLVIRGIFGVAGK